MSAEKKDWTGGGGEMDYDTLLAHYRETLEKEDPAPPKEKKKRTASLLSQLSEEGKFSRKRGSKAAAAPSQEAEQKAAEAAQKAAQEAAQRAAQEAAQKAAALEAAREALPIRLVDRSPSRPAAPGKEDPEAARPTLKTPPIRLTGKVREPAKAAAPSLAGPGPETQKAVPEPPVQTAPGHAQAEQPEEAPVALEEPKKERKGLSAFFKRKPKEPKAAEETLPDSLRASAPAEPDPEEKEPEDSRRVRGFLDLLYIQVYYIGIQLMRDMSFLRRKGAKLIAWLGEKVPQWLDLQRRRFLRICNRISDTTLFPYREIARLTSRLIRRVKGAGRGKGSFKAKVGHWWDYFRSLSRPLNHIANFIAPIVGITILAATLTYFRGVNYALSVEYAGQHLGYIAEENVFYEAQQTVTDRMLGAEYHVPGGSQPTFRIVIANKEDLEDPETLANRIIALSETDSQEADGVYIEGAFLGAMENGNEFLIYLDSILENYRTGIDHELVQFVKSITLRRGVYPIGSVLPLSRITQEMQSDQTRTLEHRVAEGEDLATIAAEYDTTTTDLLILNPALQDRDFRVNEETGEIDHASIPLNVGEQLTVANITMDLGVQVTRREVYSESIPYGVTNIEDSRYYKGYSVTASYGINGSQEVTADITYIDGEKVGETRIGTPVVTQEPVNARVIVGTMPILTYLNPNSTGNNSYLWPVKGGYVSAGLYGYAGHTGMDIAAPAGTEIRAARDGQVIYATNYSIWPYGKRVDIRHSDGAMTRYAHCSSVFVTSGQYVRQGDLIALVGRTGNASGNHCHFEIRINGSIMNPANFVGTRWPGF